MLSFKEIFSATLILFSVIDIIGSIPVIIDLRKRAGTIHSGKATFAASVIVIGFLFPGDSVLAMFGLDVASFAIAGVLVMFFIGMEMVLGIEIFKNQFT